MSDHAIKRINFFEGFFTTDEDWNAAEAYHLEKRWLHNRVFHMPGVVPVQGGGFKVAARGKGDLSIEVAPGFALDGQGHEMVLRDPLIRVIETNKLKLPQTLYVAARYFEEPADFIAYQENPRFKGHRRIEEKTEIEVTAREPDGTEAIELARIRLEEDVREIRDAVQPHAPGAGEIDLRFVPVAGVAGGHAAPRLRVELIEGLGDLCALTAGLARIGVSSASSVRTVAAVAEVLHWSNQIGPFNLAETLSPIVDLAREMVEDVEKNHAHVATRNGFADFKKSLEALQNVARDRPRNNEGCLGLARFLNAANASLALVVRERSERPEGPRIEGERTSWKDLLVRSRDFPERLNIDGSNFVLIDHLNLVHEESERAHRFSIEGQKDMWKSRQTFSYPDNTEVSDAGIAYVGGAAKWKVLNCKPGKDVVLIKRFDAILGEQTCEVLADGKKVGLWKVGEADRKHRWRNHYFLVPGSFVFRDSLDLSVRAVSAERDINMFQVWVYQPS